MSKCKSCGAEIFWIETKNGKKHPVDAEPKKLWVSHHNGEEFEWSIENCYTPHFATCPNAADHRKSKLPDPQPPLVDDEDEF